MDVSNDQPPLFNAVTASANQLFLLLRCINFVPKAQVRITKEGLRFAVEESQVMQGIVFLERSLFTAYNYNPPNPPPVAVEGDADDDEPDDETLAFQISLSSLIETLQILGTNDSKDRRSNRDFNSFQAASGFETRNPDINNLCHLSYPEIGSPLSIILEEAGVTTTCSLTTYEPNAYPTDIPLQKDAISQKIIMRSSFLHDAINELESTSPTRLTISSSPDRSPHFALSSTGPLGSATVEFSRDDPLLLETFQIAPGTKVVHSYKFSLIKAASKAMAAASKISIRTDQQGVLSLQFMIEVDNGGISFVEMRFVPFLDLEGEGEGGDDEDNQAGGND